MIAVDTSALMAILLLEPKAQLCKDALKAEDIVAISAGTLAETLIVASCRGLSAHALRLVDELQFDIVPVTAATARRIGEIYSRWGRGFHRAALNYGDCFAYDVAKQHDCKLLYVGGDFAKTDVASAL